MNSQNNMSSEKTSCTLSQNCFKQWEVEIFADKIVGQLTKVEHHASLKNWADELRKLFTANIALHLLITALTKKLEL